MSAWRLSFEEAFERWETTENPEPARSIQVLRLFLDWQEEGPPQDAIPVPLDEELYVALVPATTLVITYYVVAYERLILVKDISSPTNGRQ